MMDFNRYEIYRAAFATDDVKICNECQIIVDDPNYDFVNTMRTDSPDNTALKCKNMVFLTKNFNPAPNKYFLAQCKLEFKSDLEEYYNPSYNKKADADIVVVYVDDNDNTVKAAVFNIELDYDKTTLIIQRKIDNSLTCYTVSSSGTIANSEVINNITGKIESIHINNAPSIPNTYVYVDDIITFTSDTDNSQPVILPTQSLINNNVVVTSNSTTYATI